MGIDKKTGAKPIYVKLLLIAIALYIISACIMQADTYHRIVILEHKLWHMSCGTIPK